MFNTDRSYNFYTHKYLQIKLQQVIKCPKCDRPMAPIQKNCHYQCTICGGVLDCTDLSCGGI